MKDVDDLCLESDEVTGWNIVGKDCKVFAKEDLYGHIDGGDGLYLENGLTEYLLYNMADSLKSRVEIFACNMATSKNSSTLFNLAKDDLTDSLNLENYEDSTAIIGIFGIGTVYELHAKLGCYYFKLTFQNIENSSKAVEVSETFLNAFQTKIK